MRIWFTGEDVARTRLACGPSPLIETVLSAQGPCCPPQDAIMLGPWRRRHASTHRGLVDAVTAARKVFLDFLFEIPHCGQFQHSLERLAATSQTTLAASVAAYPARQRWRPALNRIADRDPDAIDALIKDLHAYHTAAVAPIWPNIQGRCQDDLAQRTAMLAAGGVELLLKTLNPRARWDSPVLTTDAKCTDDVHLDGAGMILVPSVFAWPHIIVIYDVAQPMIVYPITEIFGILDRPRGGADPVAGLIGRTRAEILAAIADMTVPASTTNVATHVGVSVALASHHLRVLRDARLLTVTSHGRATRHLLAPLGRQLLSQRAVG